MVKIQFNLRDKIVGKEQKGHGHDGKPWICRALLAFSSALVITSVAGSAQIPIIPFTAVSAAVRAAEFLCANQAVAAPRNRGVRTRLTYLAVGKHRVKGIEVRPHLAFLATFP